MTEEEYLQLIEGKLSAAIEELKGEMKLNDRDIAQLQELYWENFSDFDEYGYEEYENRQQMFNHANQRSMNMKTLHMYKQMQDSPYFARVDFIFDGEDEEECCYIGIGNFADEKGSMPLIYDWRAPISSLFYDYDTGKASYEAPAGRVEGEIVRKLQYKIKKGKLIYAVESDIKIDDDILKQALSMNADARLKSIVSTIQKEQNSIIRNEKDRILIVQGGAGSGKTSVALHRIAYLLYHHRNELKASQVLILSPNDVFADYISHILPELGEENINEMTFDDYAARELSGITRIESHYDFLEDVLTKENDDAEYAAARRDKLAYRTSREFAEAINAYVLALEYEIMDFKDIKYKKFSKDADSIADLFYNKLPDIPLFKRMDAVREYMVDEYTTLTGHEFDEIETEIVKDKFNALYRTRDIFSIYNEFLESIGEEPIELPEGEPRKAGYEDVYPILYMKYLLCGVGRSQRIKHLIIDEMQDYSYMQYCIIGWVFKCPMTILGDKEQSVDEGKSRVMSFLPGILGKDAKCIVLNKSYRSTVEITDYAALIAGIEGVEGIDRHGKAPAKQLYQTEEDMLTALTDKLRNELSEGVYETIAVLCKTQKEADKLGDILKKSMKVEVLNKNTDYFNTGVVVAPFYLAKGLEFDSVHIAYADKAHYYSSYHKQLLYIGATRALHALDFYGVGEGCTLLPE